MQQFNGSSLPKKKTILIVEDEAKFRHLLGQVLESENFLVRYAETGMVAKAILSTGTPEVDLVLSDVRMPDYDGVSLIKDVKGRHPQLPFILMTGFSEVLQAKQACVLGAQRFLAKPFKTRELLESVESALNPRTESEDASLLEEDDFSFCKIHVDDFTSASRLPSDIYIRLCEHRFVKVGKYGTLIDVERIRTYKEKKVEYFYVHNRDFPNYSGFALRLAKAALNSNKVSRTQKMRLFKHTSEILLTRGFIQGLDSQDVEFSKTVMQNTLNLIGDEPDLFELISMLQTHSDETYAHCVAVSVYSSLIAKKMGWTSQQTILKLSLGGFFHDIGKKELPAKLLAKSRREMTADEILLYESHCQRGKTILESLPEFPTDLIQIAFQHHETNLGTGFPLGLQQNRIHPLAKVVRLADEFFHVCQKHKDHSQVPWNSALQEIADHKAAEFDTPALKALLEIFGFPLPASLKKGRSPQ